MDQQVNILRQEYRSRVNRVMDYIENNLARPLSLDELAAVAAFSRFHFHRVFFAETGETLFQFIQRLRLEKAALILRSRKQKSITEIAFDVGFSGPDTFARAFRGVYGVSASAWRQGKESNTGKTDSNTSKDFPSCIGYPLYTREGEWNGIANLGVEIRRLEAMTMAYIRHTGPYQGDAGLFEDLFGRLYRWAGPRNLLNTPNRRDLVVYHDSPGLTEDGKLRISAGIPVPEGTAVSGEVGSMVIPESTCVIARFRPLPSEYGQAWFWVFAHWLPGSGMQPADGFSFEMYDPEEPADSEGRCTVEICVPVQPL